MFVNVGGHMIRAEKIDVVGPILTHETKERGEWSNVIHKDMVECDPYFEVTDCNGKVYTVQSSHEWGLKANRNKLIEQLNKVSKS